MAHSMISVRTNPSGAKTVQGDKTTDDTRTDTSNTIDELGESDSLDQVQPYPYLYRRFELWSIPFPVNQRSVVHQDGYVSFLWKDQRGTTYLTLFKTLSLEEEEPLTLRLSEPEPVKCQSSDAIKDDNVAIAIVHKTEKHVDDLLVVYYDGKLHKIRPTINDHYCEPRNLAGTRLIDMTNCGNVIWAITPEGEVRRYNHHLEDMETPDSFTFRDLNVKEETETIPGIRFARIATQNGRIALFTVRGLWSGGQGDIWVLDSDTGTWKCLYTLPDLLGDFTGFIFHFTETDDGQTGQTVLIKMTPEKFQIYCISIDDEPLKSIQHPRPIEFVVDFSPRTAYVKCCTPSARMNAYAIKCLIRRMEFVYKDRGITDGHLETMSISSLTDKLHLLSTDGELSICNRETKFVERRTQLTLPSSLKKLGFAGLTLRQTEDDRILVRSHEQLLMFNRHGDNVEWNKSIPELNCVTYYNQKIYCSTSHAIIVLKSNGDVEKRYDEIKMEARTIAVKPERLETEDSGANTSAEDEQNLERDGSREQKPTEADRPVIVILPEQLTGNIKLIKINGRCAELTGTIRTKVKRFGPIITDDNNNKILVADNSNGCVLVFNDNGLEESRFELPKRENSENRRRNDRLIRSLCVSEDGTLYVCTSECCYVADINV